MARRRTPPRLRAALSAVVVVAAAFACDADREDAPRRRAVDERGPEQSEREHRASAALLDDNAAALAERWRLLDEATGTIDVAYFILHDDCFGLALLGRLYERARDGVAVRLLVDARGSKPLASRLGKRPLLERLVSTGRADVRVYNPPLDALTALDRLSVLLPVARSHLKLILVDGERALVGGRNIAADYFASPRELASVAYDVDVLVGGAGIARAIERGFTADLLAPTNERVGKEGLFAVDRGSELELYARAMDIWLEGALGPLDDDGDPGATAALLEDAAARALTAPPTVTTRMLARPALVELARYRSVYGALARPRPRGFDVGARVLYDESAAAGGEREGWRQLLSLLRAARAEVVIESPYLVLTRGALEVLQDLAARGVAVTVLTNGPRSSDNPLSQALFIDAWPRLMARVPTLRLFVTDDERLMHAKRIVIDRELTLIGTLNLDLMSARVNSEQLVIARSPAFASENLARMATKREEPHVLEYRARTLDGEIVVERGPEDHVSPEVLDDLRLLRDVISRLDYLEELDPALW